MCADWGWMYWHQGVCLLEKSDMEWEIKPRLSKEFVIYCQSEESAWIMHTSDKEK